MQHEEPPPPVCPRCGSPTVLESHKAAYKIGPNRHMSYIPEDSILRYRCQGDSCRLLHDLKGDGGEVPVPIA